MIASLAMTAFAATLAAAAAAQDAGPRTTQGAAQERQELPGERSDSGKCSDLPSADELKKLLQGAPAQGEVGGTANGRYELGRGGQSVGRGVRGRRLDGRSDAGVAR